MDGRSPGNERVRAGSVGTQPPQNALGERSAGGQRESADDGSSRTRSLASRNLSSISSPPRTPFSGRSHVRDAEEEPSLPAAQHGSDGSLEAKKAGGVDRRQEFIRRVSAPTVRGVLSSEQPSSMFRTHRPSNVERRSRSTDAFLAARHRAILHEISGQRRLSVDDFASWDTLLSLHKFPVVVTEQDAYDLDLATLPAAQVLAHNNQDTANFGALLINLLGTLKRMEQRNYSGQVPIEAYNAVFLTRVFVKHLLCDSTAKDIQSLFEFLHPLPSPRGESGKMHSDECADPRLDAAHAIIKDSRSRAELVLDSLIRLVLKLEPRTSETYEIYMEAVGCLIVFLSTQLYRSSAKPDGENYFMNIWLGNLSHYASPVAERLISNFVDDQAAPATGIGGIAVSAYHFLFPPSPTVTHHASSYPLARRSILLFLLLANQQCPGTPLMSPTEYSSENAIRRAIGSIGEGTQDFFSDGRRTSLPEISDCSLSGTGKLSLRIIYKTICQRISEDETVTLFYLLLVDHEGFRNFALSRTEPEELVLPILKNIYQTVERSGNHPPLYLLLVSVLLLSQDTAYCKGIHNVIITSPPWFTERLITNISLGGMVALVLIRTIQFNLIGRRDMYIHVNCVATLVNMSTTFANMHQYVAQRLVSLFELVAKRYQKVLAKGTACDGNVSPTDVDQADEEVLVLGNLIGILLQLMNVVFAQSVVSNSQLVYAVVHRKELFGPLRALPQFVDMVSTIDSLVGHFHDKLADANLHAPSAEDVREVIQLAARTWNSGKAKNTSIMRFEYQEATDSEEFFCPYLWSLILQHTLMYWDGHRMQLLHELWLS